LGVSLFAICAELIAGCCGLGVGCFVAAFVSLGALEFATCGAFADCGFVDCSSVAFTLLAAACEPLVAVRDAEGSVGFLVCDVVGDAVFGFSDATSLLLGVEFESAVFAGEVAAVSPIGCERSLDGD
jgi:hypothetical protein